MIQPFNSEIMSWDPENMETYWQQCRRYDSRPFDTLSISSHSTTHIYQNDFLKTLERFVEKRQLKLTF